MITLLIIICSCFATSIGFNVGKYVEWSKWNKLIKECKLPKPGLQWSYRNVPRR